MRQDPRGIELADPNRRVPAILADLARRLGALELAAKPPARQTLLDAGAAADVSIPNFNVPTRVVKVDGTPLYLAVAAPAGRDVNVEVHGSVLARADSSNWTALKLQVQSASDDALFTTEYGKTAPGRSYSHLGDAGHSWVSVYSHGQLVVPAGATRRFSLLVYAPTSFGGAYRRGDDWSSLSLNPRLV